MLNRYYYHSKIDNFLNTPPETVLGILSQESSFDIGVNQRDAWRYQIEHLKDVLVGLDGNLFFEFVIPRIGGRIDAVLIVRNVIFILEYKVGEKEFLRANLDQVWDYAIDLKNFHETSHKSLLAPVLIATEAKTPETFQISQTTHHDDLLIPIKSNAMTLRAVIDAVLAYSPGENIDVEQWSMGRYSPTPTIIEAAKALYNNHSVKEISRSDAAAENLTKTSASIDQIIEFSKTNRRKAICFVTGVPGAGKTLVGLDIATKHLDKELGSTSVFLSGNGPLVAVLREALTRDRVKREKELGKKITKGEVLTSVKTFIQNVHHFRDEYLRDKKAPVDHVAIFDEAQRAWNHAQTAAFMKRKKNVPDFVYSEPEFLISCLDRHEDWAVIVCLVGGGQEINTGEAGITEWIESLNRSFSDWDIYISPHLTDSEYAAGGAIEQIEHRQNVFRKDELHLSVSLRSFRAEHLSKLVKCMLDMDVPESKKYLDLVRQKYPIVITRDFIKAKQWLKEKARGTERFGMVVSSQAQRLKPYAIDVKTPMNPIHWFLENKDHVRSSYYLEDVATEFHVQGLELDWACVAWDADFRFTKNGWDTFSFVGNKWNRIKKDERKVFLKNAYRVLLTRARQGMVIVVPHGAAEDPTRSPAYYNNTYNFLKSIGFDELG